MTLRKRCIQTPTGDMTLVADDRALVGLFWDDEGGADAGLIAAANKNTGANAALDAGARQLEEYFAGKRARFDLPLDPAGTAFQRSVWARLQSIPFGETWSYRELASRVGNPDAARAVGAANGRNPLCILIPCHRVVRASGDLGGYSGGTRRKAFLLDLEKGYPSR